MLRDAGRWIKSDGSQTCVTSRYRRLSSEEAPRCIRTVDFKALMLAAELGQQAHGIKPGACGKEFADPRKREGTSCCSEANFWQSIRLQGWLQIVVGRGRALEILLTADDYSADMAELYGWINRALPQNQIAGFVSQMAHRIARFPRRGVLEVKARMNELTLQSADHFRQDSDAFSQGMKNAEVQATIKRAMQKGFGTPKEAELRLGDLLGEE